MFTLYPPTKKESQFRHENGGIVRIDSVYGGDPIQFIGKPVFVIEQVGQYKKNYPESFKIGVTLPNGKHICLPVKKQKNKYYLDIVIEVKVKKIPIKKYKRFFEGGRWVTKEKTFYEKKEITIPWKRDGFYKIYGCDGEVYFVKAASMENLMAETLWVRHEIKDGRKLIQTRGYQPPQ